jgi:hypothetical protein
MTSRTVARTRRLVVQARDEVTLTWLDDRGGDRWLVASVVEVQKRVHHLRVELTSAAAYEFALGFLGGSGRAVRSWTGDHVEGVHRRHNPCRKWDLLLVSPSG